jgi:transcriptional regulator with XRE-family HTH domain
VYSSQIARRVLSAINENEELNQTKLATALNISPQQVSKIVKGKENLTLETIYKLSESLNVELITFPLYSFSSKNIELEITLSSNIYIAVFVNSIFISEIIDIDNFNKNNYPAQYSLDTYIPFETINTY